MDDLLEDEVEEPDDGSEVRIDHPLLEMSVTASTEHVPDMAHARITPTISQSDAERHLRALQDIDATIKLWEPKDRAGKIEAIVQRAIADLHRETVGVDHDAPGHKCLYCAPLGEVETMLRQRAEDAPEREAEDKAEYEAERYAQAAHPPCSDEGQVTQGKPMPCSGSCSCTCGTNFPFPCDCLPQHVKDEAEMLRAIIREVVRVNDLPGGAVGDIEDALGAEHGKLVAAVLGYAR